MSPRVPPLSPEVQALLEKERAIPTQPPAVRQRALARARAAITAYPQRSARPRAAGSRMPHMAVRPHRKRWFVATMLTCAAAAAAGTTAFQLRARFAGEPHHAAPAASRPAPAPRIVTAPVAAADVPEDVPDEEAPVLAPPAPRTGAPAPGGDGARLELRLLRQARAAVARQDFGAALARIGEHARRFKDGRLAEEREALRVKALAGLGRSDEARRAAAAFKVRFPRSVLLPAVTRLAGS
jgi:hypothetical protein